MVLSDARVVLGDAGVVLRVGWQALTPHGAAEADGHGHAAVGDGHSHGPGPGDELDGHARHLDGVLKGLVALVALVFFFAAERVIGILHGTCTRDKHKVMEALAPATNTR